MNKNKFLFWFLLCALIPLAGAKLALAFGWFSETSVNRGQWVREELQLLSPHGEAAHRWHLVYIQRGGCVQQCSGTLQLLQQLYIGLGAKQDRVELIAFAAPDKLMREALVRDYPLFQWRLLRLGEKSSESNIYLVNPRGMALLQYDPDAAQLAQDIRTDLLRLLKYDREGL